MPLVPYTIEALHAMKSYPKELYYEGNLALLDAPKISIVGSRKPTGYSKQMTYQLAAALGKVGIVVVSGGAMGIDAIAHNGASSSATIAVLPCGIDIKYPSVNKKLLTSIEEQGLLLSQFPHSFKAAPWSFVARNEVVVALGEILIVAEAELESGSMRSVEYAKKMGKEIFVLPQRVGESAGTNALLAQGEARAIYDIDAFVLELCQRFGLKNLSEDTKEQDPFILFCKTTPTYDEALQKFPSKVFEAELNGTILIKNARVYLA
jgi:DNA processing protein